MRSEKLRQLATTWRRDAMILRENAATVQADLLEAKATELEALLPPRVKRITTSVSL